MPGPCRPRCRRRRSVLGGADHAVGADAVAAVALQAAHRLVAVGARDPRVLGKPSRCGPSGRRARRPASARTPSPGRSRAPARRSRPDVADQARVVGGAEPDVVREQGRAEDVRVAVDGVDAPDRGHAGGRCRAWRAPSRRRRARARPPAPRARSPCGHVPPPLSTEPMWHGLDLRPAYRGISGWIICPTFSSSDIGGEHPLHARLQLAVVLMRDVTRQSATSAACPRSARSRAPSAACRSPVASPARAPGARHGDDGGERDQRDKIRLIVYPSSPGDRPHADPTFMRFRSMSPCQILERTDPPPASRPAPACSACWPRPARRRGPSWRGGRRSPPRPCRPSSPSCRSSGWSRAARRPPTGGPARWAPGRAGRARPRRGRRARPRLRQAPPAGRARRPRPPGARRAPRAARRRPARRRGDRPRARLVDEVLDEAGAAPPDIVGVGMGLPGPVHRPTGELGDRRSCPAGSACAPRTRCRPAGYPVQVENDASLAALSEYMWGAGQGSDDLVYLKLATGVGAGDRARPPVRAPAGPRARSAT